MVGGGSTIDEQDKYLVCIVDDDETNLAKIKLILSKEDFHIFTFTDGEDVLKWIDKGSLPDLVISDVVMSRVDGFTLCRTLKERPETRSIQVILVTGLDEVEDKVKGLEAGADDFITKPFHPSELRARVKTQLRIRALHRELDYKNQLLIHENERLDDLVRVRTHELEELTIGIVAAFEKANALKDVDTGLHIKRVCLYSEVLARQLRLDRQTIDKIRRFASLHDVGKVGIPDVILKKEGPLTNEERSQMQLHTVYGYDLLGLARADRMAQMIALCHHEKWNGTGYPKGLKGDEIPLEARIVALADVYDAITTSRCYKPAIPHEEAIGIVRGEAGEHFDPKMVEAMLSARDDFLSIGETYKDRIW